MMVGQVTQNLALYEKLRVVGKGKIGHRYSIYFDCGFGLSGAFGVAVLYKKKDDESLVIIKEINMLLDQYVGPHSISELNEVKLRTYTCGMLVYLPL